MAKYRTANGKTLDMAALAAKNERVRAVGNMKVNARGDTIDSMGRVVKSATKKTNENYSKTVGNRSAQAKRQPPKKTAPKPVILEELSNEEKELNSDMEDDAVVEQIKAKERED